MLRNPVPMGVVIGPLRATLVRRQEAKTLSGSGVPAVFIMSSPASTCSHVMSTPVAAITFLTTVHISGPVPSPGISVTSCLIKSPLPFLLDVPYP